jgi:NADH:ubiquinone oxidoreductase subunit K
MISFILVAAAALLGISLAGIITDRHFVVIMLAIELMLISSSILLVYFFAYSIAPDASVVPMLVSIWSVAAVEVITLITFYVYMKSRGFDFDVTKLSKLRW